MNKETGHKICFLILFLFYLTLNVCAQKYTEKILVVGSECNPGEAIFSNDSIIDNQFLHLVSFDSLTYARFSAKSLQTAMNLGLADLMIQYAHLEKNKSSDSVRILFLETKQKMNDLILLASFDINTTISEINCQIQQLQEIRIIGQRELDRKNRKLTLSSLFIGFGTAAVASAFDIFSPNENELMGAISFSGAAIASYIILKQLKLKKSFTMMHYRNPLTDIKYAPLTSTFYPPTIWSYINNQTYSISDSITNREYLITQFEEMNVLQAEKKITEQDKLNTYFGTHGIYTLESLDNKIYMMDIVSKRIAIMRYDLKVLEQELLISR